MGDAAGLLGRQLLVLLLLLLLVQGECLESWGGKAAQSPDIAVRTAHAWFKSEQFFTLWGRTQRARLLRTAGVGKCVGCGGWDFEVRLNACGV